MLGWEFPPLISGGLGTACEGLARAMADRGMSVLFLLPGLIEARQGTAGSAGGGRTPGSLGLHTIPSSIRSPYPGASHEAGAHSAQGAFPDMHMPGLRVRGTGAGCGYHGDLGARVLEYGQRCTEVAAGECFDVIHAHDWMTFPAAKRIAEHTGKPWVAHVHATEFDRSGESINQAVYDLEWEGVHTADRVLTVSRLTKQNLVEHYGVPPSQIDVVHNGVRPVQQHDGNDRPGDPRSTVLFAGRLTRQKAPHIVMEAAEQVIKEVPTTRFVIAGCGDLTPHLVEEVAKRGLARSVFFAGFLTRTEMIRAYRTADVYVMPSVSEPFGLTALEALQNGVPCVISKTSGVAEVLDGGALKVDWWDVHGWACAIGAILKDQDLACRLAECGREEAAVMTWKQAAAECMARYRTIMERTS
jgi:glycosyltransferase involved in cell wall biosynthesis